MTSNHHKVENHLTFEHLFPLLGSGFIAANIAEAATLPLDTIRVRMMVFEKKWKKGAFHCFRKIAKTEGPQALFNGLGAGLIRQSIFAPIRLCLFDVFNHKLKAEKGADNITLFDRAVMGALSGTIAITVANPADSIKTRLQTDSTDSKSGKEPRYRGFNDAAKKMWKAEGMRGYYQSLKLNIMRNSLTNAAELGVYDQTKTYLLKNELLDNGFRLQILCSSVAGFSGALIMSPVDVIKTKLQSGRPIGKGKFVPYVNDREAAMCTWRESGWRGFYKGFSASCQRKISWSIIMFVTRARILDAWDKTKTQK